jgi:hypothetical protein
MSIVYLVDRGDPRNTDFFAGRSNGFVHGIDAYSGEPHDVTLV